MAKSIQALAGNLIAEEAGQEVSEETMLMLSTLYQEIETVCFQAAKELEAEMLKLAELV